MKSYESSMCIKALTVKVPELTIKISHFDGREKKNIMTDNIKRLFRISFITCLSDIISKGPFPKK